MIRGNVDSLVKLITALEDAGIELIDDGANSDSGGRGVRLRVGSGDRAESKTPSGARARK
jgi:hypothetical protein